METAGYISSSSDGEEGENLRPNGGGDSKAGHHALVAADAGGEHAARQVVLPSFMRQPASGQAENSSDDESDDDTAYAAGQSIDDVARTQGVKVTVLSEAQRRKHARMVAEGEKMFQLQHRKMKTRMHRFSVMAHTASMHIAVKRAVGFVRRSGLKTPHFRYSADPIKTLPTAVRKFSAKLKLGGLTVNDQKGGYFGNARLNQLFESLNYETGFEMAYVTFLHLFAAGFVSRIVHAIRPIERGVPEGRKRVEESSKKPETSKSRAKKSAKQSKAKKDDEDDVLENPEEFQCLDKDGNGLPSVDVLFHWCEVWSEDEARWLCVNPLTGTVDDYGSIRSSLPVSVQYVFGYDSEGGVRDVSPLYIADFTNRYRRVLRMEEWWIGQRLDTPIYRANLYRSICELDFIRGFLMSLPMPTKVADFKGHYLYVLENDILVKEAIHPAAPVVGKLGKRTIYPRLYVTRCDIALRWLRLGRSVKEGEKPYKMVKGRVRPRMRPKHGPPLPPLPAPPPVPAFGTWQTEMYKAPPLIDGEIIPTNEHGNIYMYRPWMAPEGCIHVKDDQAEVFCVRAGINFSKAVVTWAFKKCMHYPVFEGCVIKESNYGFYLDALRAGLQSIDEDEYVEIRKKLSEMRPPKKPKQRRGEPPPVQDEEVSVENENASVQKTPDEKRKPVAPKSKSGVESSAEESESDTTDATDSDGSVRGLVEPKTTRAAASKAAKKAPVAKGKNQKKASPVPNDDSDPPLPAPRIQRPRRSCVLRMQQEQKPKPVQKPKPKAKVAPRRAKDESSDEDKSESESEIPVSDSDDDDEYVPVKKSRRSDD